MTHPRLLEGMELVPCAVSPDGTLWIPHANGNWVSAAMLHPFSKAIVACWLEEQPAPPNVTDTELLDFVQAEYLDLLTFVMPTGGGDADVGWKAIQHHMTAPKEREVGVSHHDDLRAAIRNAMQALRYLPHGVRGASEGKAQESGDA